MKDYFKRTKMLDEAKLQSKARRPIIEMLLFFLVFVIGSAAQSFFIYPAVFLHLANSDDLKNLFTEAVVDQEKFYQSFEALMSELPDWITLVTLFSTYALIVTAIVYCRCFEKRSLSSMGFRSRGVVSEYFTGILIGAFLFSAVVGLGYIIGAFKFEGFAGGNIAMIILYFFGYIIQGMSEEVLIHGYYMTSVSRSTSTSYALLSSSLMFALLHWGNNGIGIIPFINLVLFGLVMGIYVLKRGNIWGACAIHSLWNFMEGNVFGLSVSGMSKSPSVFSFVPKDGVENITGNAFGPEGGLLVTLILFLALGAVFMMKTNKYEVSDIVFEKDDGESEENDENI